MCVFKDMYTLVSGLSNYKAIMMVYHTYNQRYIIHFTIPEQNDYLFLLHVIVQFYLNNNEDLVVSDKFANNKY